MPSLQSTDLDLIAQNLRMPPEQVQRTLTLLDEGNTVAFVARFRKDQTGGLNEEQVSQVHRQVTRQRLLSERKQTILKSIESQGKLTATLESLIRAAPSTKRLEDLYLPYKPKKQTLATLARQRGLEPFAREILDSAPAARQLDTRANDFVSPGRGLNSAAEVLLGVGHLLAERFSERADLRSKLRKAFHHSGQLVSAGPEEPTNQARSRSGNGISAKDRKRQRLEKAFADYCGFRESIAKVPPHRILAINRGERAKVLRVKVEGDAEAMFAAATTLLIDEEHPHVEFLRACVRDALNRLVLPSLEREIRRELTEKAEDHAVQVFARNLRKLLLQPPVRGRRILAIDPGFRSGCKIVTLDEFGNVLENSVLHVIGGDERMTQGRTTLVDMIRRLDISVVAIGNGTACRETEKLVSETLAEELQGEGAVYVMVNEAGTSAYSTSPIACEELPDHDAEERGAISIGRRLLDPLSELVKINPANIGVGLYQHDVKARHLRESLDAVVESCVNYVGVDANTASPALLSYVSGLNQLTARRLFDHRREHGPFRNRNQFREVTGIGEATIVQAAGFLKITDGDNPLDATWIHPESYDVARRVLEHLGSNVDELAGVVGQRRVAITPHGESPNGQATEAGTESLPERVARVDAAALAEELGIGELLLEDILTSLAKPGRDPRDDLPPPAFRTGIMRLEDLKQDMELSGTVLNVVDFGAFVDIGISDSALVHISRLADRFVRDTHEIVSVGDILTVWVLDVDKTRRRVSLTAVKPGTEKRGTSGNHRAEGTVKTKKKPSAKAPANSQSHERSAAGPRKRMRPPKPRGSDRPRQRKPTRPITDAMVDGNEPMRSFSDLIQYFEKKQPKTDDSNPGNE
ncbi:MAG: Tex-like N-terminal domain-containing protein [Pirellulaceae bacterium]